jgi:hypothetical protein
LRISFTGHHLISSLSVFCCFSMQEFSLTSSSSSLFSSFFYLSSCLLVTFLGFSRFEKAERKEVLKLNVTNPDLKIKSSSASLTEPLV